MKFQVIMNLNESFFFYAYFAFVPMCRGFLTRLIELSRNFFKKKMASQTGFEPAKTKSNASLSKYSRASP